VQVTAAETGTVETGDRSGVASSRCDSANDGCSLAGCVRLDDSGSRGLSVGEFLVWVLTGGDKRGEPGLVVTENDRGVDLLQILVYVGFLTASLGARSIVAFDGDLADLGVVVSVGCDIATGPADGAT